VNQRIQELALRAGFIDRGSNHTAYMNFDHEKFAQLIVQECIDYCGENLSKTVGGALKIHFGVEE